MIRRISGVIRRASHYGASGNEEFVLSVSVGFDASEFNKMKRKKQNPIENSIVDVKNAVYSATWIDSMPYVQNKRDWKRAQNGIKTIELTFYLSENQASALGVDVSEWCVSKSIELQSHFEKTKGNLFSKSILDNLIEVDFKQKKRVS